jgi:DNA topoisomerase VI subunit B
VTTPPLQRETFVTSRLLEYFDKDELEMQIGHERALWPLALSKELIDNGIDACESAGIPPEIRLSLRDDSLVVEDNGPGLPAEIVARSLDYAVRVSTNTRYVSPTRGQLGSALKTVWAAAFVANDGHGLVEIEALGTRHIVDVSIDRLAQAPRIEHQREPSARRNGTLLRMPWPSLASMLVDDEEPDSSHRRRFVDLAASYALFNPHLALTLEAQGASLRWQATVPCWQKWTPASPTSAHWYTAAQFADLIAAYLVIERETGRARTVRDLIAEFRGLSSTAKLRAVAKAAGLHGARLADLCHDEQIDLGAVGPLLAAMRQASRPVDGKQLGTIGKEAFKTGLVRQLGVSDGSFRYERLERVLGGERLAGTTLPVVLEVGFGVLDRDVRRRLVLTGVNWSPTLEPAFPSLQRALSDANVRPDDPVVLAVHVALPAVSFSDRGKGRLTVDVRSILDPAVEKVTREWTKAKRQRLRMQRSALNRFMERLADPTEKPLSIKEACFQVMERAYLKASANGRLPAMVRQIMYAARPMVLALTGGRFYKADSQTFQQQTLIDFMEAHPELTADWQVVWDARGHFVEPHGGQDVDLGTLDVRAYIQSWSDGRVPHLGINLSGGRLFSGSGPAGRYGAVLFVEKEGFDELFDRVRLRDRYDLAIMSTKGVSHTAARELVDASAGVGLPIFLLHDFDKAGMTIAHTLVTTSRRYRFKHVPRVIDLGLRLDDVLELGLEGLSEPVEYTSNKDPRENLAESRATDAEQRFLVSGGRPGAWTGRRVELNAMTSDQLVAWLERKLDQHGVTKVVPDRGVLDEAYRHAVRLARLSARMQSLVDEIRDETIDVPADLAARVTSTIEGTPVAWDAAIREIAQG